MSMFFHDPKTNLVVAASINPAVIITTTQTGTGVDLLNGDGLCSVEVTAGAITDGTHTISVQESADNSTFSTITIPDDSAIVLSSTTTAGSVQYVSFQRTLRYVRVVSTVTGSPGTGGYYSANVMEQLKYISQ
jgi:hypothetical protein